MDVTTRARLCDMALRLDTVAEWHEGDSEWEALHALAAELHELAHNAEVAA